MLEFYPYPSPQRRPVQPRVPSSATLDQSGDKSLEARVKPDCVHLYPGVDPKVWYKVVQEGEYRDEMEGLWIQVNDWVTYVLAKHFDLQSGTELH
jgi:glycerol-3-phosphate responsive antiterminator